MQLISIVDELANFFGDFVLFYSHSLLVLCSNGNVLWSLTTRESIMGVVYVFGSLPMPVFFSF